MHRHFDLILVGQGLAGTTLAWRMLAAGLRILILDRQEPCTSSKIAAGLMTPVTGKRLAKTSDWEQFWAEAASFYRDVENRTKTLFFEERQMLRIFQNQTEKTLFERKRTQLANGVSFRDPFLLNQDFRESNAEGFEMSGGRLRVKEYLAASRIYFQSIAAYENFDLHVEDDLELASNRITISRLQVSANQIIFCQGYQTRILNQLKSVKFNPCKGEILTVQIHNFREDRILHKGLWIAQKENDSYLVGATYDWQNLSAGTTTAGRDWITSRLDSLLKNNYTIIDHQAAIRPTMHDFQPVLGMLAGDSRVGMFNGLGSKGSLLAPRLARLLTDHLLIQTPIPPEVSLSRWDI